MVVVSFTVVAVTAPRTVDQERSLSLVESSRVSLLISSVSTPTTVTLLPLRVSPPALSVFFDLILIRSGACGDVAHVCQEFKGVLKSAGVESAKLDTTDNCLGAQGKLESLPAC